MCIERTTLRIAQTLPGILRWFEVVEKHKTILSPIENAIDTVTKKNAQIQSLTRKLSANQKDQTNVNQLTMMLSGTIDAAVGGGLKKFEEVRISP